MDQPPIKSHELQHSRTEASPEKTVYFTSLAKVVLIRGTRKYALNTPSTKRDLENENQPVRDESFRTNLSTANLMLRSG